MNSKDKIIFPILGVLAAVLLYLNFQIQQTQSHRLYEIPRQSSGQVTLNTPEKSP